MIDQLAQDRPESSTEVLTKVMRLLQELEQDARMSADASYQQRRIESLRSQLPDKMRRVLDMHLRMTERRLLERYPIDQFGEKALRVSKAIRRKTIRDVHAENLYDSILSTPEYPIHSKAYGISLLYRHLATMAIDKSPPSMLETYGWMSLDMNGVKGMVDCTTYQHVTHYLQAVAQFLLDRQGTTRRWLESQNIKVIPLAAGGDEYALLLDGEGPMSKDFFEEVSGRYMDELATREELSRFLDFSDRAVQLEYSLPTEAQRAAFFQMTPDQQGTYLESVGDLLLPDSFYSTGGMGGANLAEGTRRAVERGSLSLDDKKESFDSVRFEIIDHTKQLAEARQAEDKQRFKESLIGNDAKFRSFLIRNEENRRLDQRLCDSQTQLAQEKQKSEDMERDMEALRALCSQQSARIEQLLGHCEYR